MTIGQLSQRTGVPIKVLREYERLGFLYTLGRSESNYRLFGEEAVWCVQVTQGMRSLGLTLNEIRAVVTQYLGHPDEPVDAVLDQQLAQALKRIETRIADLQTLRQRIFDFQEACAGTQTPPAVLTCLFGPDPRRNPTTSAS